MQVEIQVRCLLASRFSLSTVQWLEEKQQEEEANFQILKKFLNKRTDESLHQDVRVLLFVPSNQFISTNTRRTTTEDFDSFQIRF